MGEVGEGKSMSYAAIVSPGGGGGAAPAPAVGGQPEAAVEAKEVVAEEAHHPIDDDLEGFQEVTSKKEKVRDRDKPRTREMKEGSHEHGDEQHSSKEITPEKDEVDKEEIEYVPAPPPKTNPWKKPVVDQVAVPEKSSKPSSDAKTIETTVVTEKLKAEKAPKVKAGES